jgi:hypothetical protein
LVLLFPSDTRRENMADFVGEITPAKEQVAPITFPDYYAYGMGGIPSFTTDKSLTVNKDFLAFGAAPYPNQDTPAPSMSKAEKIQEQRTQSAYDALNAPITPSNGPVDPAVETQAQQLAKLAIDAQNALGTNTEEREKDLVAMGTLVKQLSPDAAAAVLNETNNLLNQDNLKIVRDSQGEVWEGSRTGTNSPYFLSVGLLTRTDLNANERSLKAIEPKETRDPQR